MAGTAARRVSLTSFHTPSTSFTCRDTIALFSDVVGGLPQGPLAESAFATGAAAADNTDRIIYDPATGSLFFDADGAGGEAQIRFAVLQPGLAVSAADIEVFFAA